MDCCEVIAYEFYRIRNQRLQRLRRYHNCRNLSSNKEGCLFSCSHLYEKRHAKIFSPFAALRGYDDEIASEGRDHLKGNRIELSEEGKQALNQKISQLRKGQSVKVQYFTDGYYEDIAGVLDAVDAINKELRIYTGFINDTGKELPTIIAFEDILEIGVNMT